VTDVAPRPVHTESPQPVPPAGRPGPPMRYYIYLEGEPTLDWYRLDDAPRENLCPVFLCPYAVVTGESGATYNLMRGVQGQSKGTVVNMGVYRLNGALDEQCPMLFSWDDSPVSEPYWVAEDRDAVSYVGETFRFDFGVDRYGWEDAGGKVKLEARRLGKPCTFWVPVQDGYEYPQLLRNYLGKIAGTIDGDPVEGLFMLDYIYSRPDAMWSEMGMLSKLHNLWMNWLVEYEDGTLEGGYGWRGRPGTGFAAAHHYVDGVSTARSDPQITTTSTERGTIETVELRLGDLTVELEQSGSTDWPLHTCGTVSSISRDKRIAKSWNYTEYFPMNWSAVMDYQAAHHALYGGHPSFRRLMQGARVENEQLVYDR
jgi:hypothetical protein